MSDTPTENISVSELAAKYAARLDALEIQKETLTHIINAGQIWGTLIGTIIVLLGGYVFWRYGKSWKEIQIEIKSKVQTLFHEALTENQSEAKSMESTRETYEKLVTGLEEIKKKLKVYSDLSDALQTVYGFDPLENYLALASEIDQREEATLKQLKESGSEAVSDISSTTNDPQFRHRAALIFAKLLEDVKKGQEGKKPLIDVITLFNAASNAAKVDMDFVALELMEVAVAQDKSNAPDNRVRLVRQRLTMSYISDTEAFDELSAILSDTRAFDLHLVLLEASNIGIYANDPQGVVTLIDKHLPATLQNISYTHLKKAQLLTFEMTNAADKMLNDLKAQGLQRLNQEEPGARWYRYSIEEARALGLDVSYALDKYIVYQSNR